MADVAEESRRADLVGCINNWANDVRPSAGNSTSMNFTTSNSQTHGMSHVLSSTTPSLITKATSVSSAAFEATPAYKKTPMQLALHPTNTTINLEESDDEFIKPISEAAQTGSKCMHADYAKAGYVVTSEVDKVDDAGSNKVSCVTAMPAKKLQISQHGDTMAKQSGESAIASTIPSQFSSAGANSTGMGGRHICYINRHLPPTLQEDRKWTKLILPALLMWAGSLGNPWATWWLGVWQSNFSSTTIALMAHFLASDSDNTQSLVAVQQTCIELLDGFAFLYQDLNPTTPEKAY
ncbi:hypothetical protein V8B97DRAFT_2025491 [Scleroderma yunnanense]